jgi:hypothetical protein
MFADCGYLGTREARLSGMPMQRRLARSFTARLWINRGQASLQNFPVKNGTAPLP